MEGIEQTGSATQHQKARSQTTMDELAAAMLQLQISIREQNQEINRIRTTQAAQSTSVPNAAAPTAYEPTNKLGKLPEYHGDKAELQAWTIQARNKLREDYGGAPEDLKVGALYAKLRGKALRSAVPWMKRQDVTRTAEGLLDQLKRAFGDDLHRRRAAKQLESIKMGTRTFPDFYTEFQQLMDEAEAHSWADDNKVEAFERALPRWLHRGIEPVLATMEGSFDDWVNTARKFALRREVRPSYPAPATPSSNEHDPDEMDWESTRRTNERPQKNGRKERGNDKRASAKPQESGKRRAKWVAREELDKRIKEGRCIRCGSRRHWAQECDLLPARSPQKARPAKIEEEDAGMTEGEDESEQSKE